MSCGNKMPALHTLSLPSLTVIHITHNKHIFKERQIFIAEMRMFYPEDKGTTFL